MRNLRLSIAVIVVTTLARTLPARASCLEHPFSALDTRLSHLAKPTQLALLGGALAAPLVMAPTGADQRIRVIAQRDLGGRYDAEHLSLVVPFGLAAALSTSYLLEVATGDCTGSAVTSRALQGMGVSFVVVTLAKRLVGRRYLAGGPDGADRLVDDGRSTHLEPFSSFGAWPSGHAATTFAFAAVIRVSLPRAGVLRYVGYLLASAVSAGMMFGDHHWGSDLVSGALLGEAIGRSVAERPTTSTEPSVAFVPTALGLSLVGALP